MNEAIKRTGWMVCVVTLLISGSQAAIWYVDDNATEPQEGRSWDTAFRTLNQALDRAEREDTILIAQGAYTPEDDPFLGVTSTRQVGCNASTSLPLQVNSIFLCLIH